MRNLGLLELHLIRKGATMERVITKRPNGGRRVIQRLSRKQMTEPQHAGTTNINEIMAKYHKSGLLPQQMEGYCYGDFSSGENYHEIQNKLLAAQESFLSLPSDLRRRFENDPAQFLDFYQDPENAAELVEMGLLPRQTLADTHQHEKNAQIVRERASKAKEKKGQDDPPKDAKD